jgi:hypothetical protein
LAPPPRRRRSKVEATKTVARFVDLKIDMLKNALGKRLPTPKTQPHKGDRPPRSTKEFVDARNRAIDDAKQVADLALLKIRRPAARKFGSGKKRQRRRVAGHAEIAKILALPDFGKFKPTKDVIMRRVRDVRTQKRRKKKSAPSRRQPL